MHAQRTDARSLRILLVEDSRVQAILVKNAIQEVPGLELMHVASDGEEAMSFLRELTERESGIRPDLILLDLNMPRKDGFQTLREIKGDRRFQKIPVIIHTTSDLEEDIARAYANGASTFLSKSAGFDELLRSLQDLARYWGRARLPAA